MNGQGSPSSLSLCSTKYPTTDSMMNTQPAFNYRYLIDHAARIGGQVLDYGCGRGQGVCLGRAQGLDIWGADTVSGYYADWAHDVEPDARDRIRGIVNGRADYPDNHFDLVVS